MLLFREKRFFLQRELRKRKKCHCFVTAVVVVAFVVVAVAFVVVWRRLLHPLRENSECQKSLK